MTLRVLPWLVLLFLLPLGACGDRVPAGPRLQVKTMTIDGPLPKGLFARLVDRPNAAETYPLVPVPGDAQGVFVLPGAPGGAYQVEAPGGWMSLQAGRMPPTLEAGRPPPLLQLGHPHTVYILPASLSARAGSNWGAWRVPSDGGVPQPIPIEVKREPPGYIAALRFPADEWHGDIELAGDVLLAVPGNEEAEAGRGPLAQPYRFQARPHLQPVIIALQIAPTAPLVVALMPVGQSPRAEGATLRVEVTGLPIPFFEDAEFLEGTVRFPSIPSVDRALLLHRGGEAAPLRIESELWRKSSSLYVLDAAPSEFRRLRVNLPAETQVVQAVARTATGDAYGLVSFDQAGSSGVLGVPPEAEEVFLDAGRTWAHLVREDLSGDEVSPEFRPTFVYQGTVRGKLDRAVVRLFRQVGEKAFSGQGFEIPVPPQGAFHGRFPLGRYLVEVTSRRGVRKRDHLLVVEEPKQFHVRLDAP